MLRCCLFHHKYYAEESLFSAVGFHTITIGTMSATAFATIPPFKQILLCKYPIPLLRKVKIALFQGNMFFHRFLTINLVVKVRALLPEFIVFYDFENPGLFNEFVTIIIERIQFCKQNPVILGSKSDSQSDFSL